MRPREILTAFDRYLADREFRLDAVVIGGAALTLRCLGREDPLRSRLFALCDRGIDLQQDANPGWPAHVRATIGDVARRLGHGL